MRRTGGFRMKNLDEWRGLYFDYLYDWDHNREYYPPELIPLFEKDRKLRTKFAEIKIAQKQWAKGYAPVGGVVDPGIAQINPNPDLQYAAFMNMYMPKEKKTGVG